VRCCPEFAAQSLATTVKRQWAVSSVVERLVYTERLTSMPTFAHVLSPTLHRENAQVGSVSSVPKCAQKISPVDKEVDKAENLARSVSQPCDSF
jgi:hypothetical protein